MASSLLNLHLHVVGSVVGATAAPFSWKGRDWPVYPSQAVAALSASFDDALDRIGWLPRMFVEPDGSFLWSSPRGESPAWRLDGDMRDGGATLRHVTLSGSCPEAEFRQLLACLRVGDEPLLFELAAEGLRLGLDDLLAYCRTGETPSA